MVSKGKGNKKLEKVSKKVLTKLIESVIIALASQENRDFKNLKKNKKVLDKQKQKCYNKDVS